MTTRARPWPSPRPSSPPTSTKTVPGVSTRVAASAHLRPTGPAWRPGQRSGPLRADEAGRHADAIARGGTWLRALETTTVLDAASVVLGLGRDTDGGAVAQRRRCLQLIVDGEAPSGGWGAYLASRTEPFDTALVVLALRPLLDAPELLAPTLTPNRTRELVSRGRAFLLTEQLDDGSWVETTRPPGQQSYAQYVSTTGWATMALLETAELP